MPGIQDYLDNIEDENQFINQLRHFGPVFRHCEHYDPYNPAAVIVGGELTYEGWWKKISSWITCRDCRLYGEALADGTCTVEELDRIVDQIKNGPEEEEFPVDPDKLEAVLRAFDQINDGWAIRDGDLEGNAEDPEEDGHSAG